MVLERVLFECLTSSACCRPGTVTTGTGGAARVAASKKTGGGCRGGRLRSVKVCGSSETGSRGRHAGASGLPF